MHDGEMCFISDLRYWIEADFFVLELAATCVTDLVPLSQVILVIG